MRARTVIASILLATVLAPAAAAQVHDEAALRETTVSQSTGNWAGVTETGHFASVSASWRVVCPAAGKSGSDFSQWVGMDDVKSIDQAGTDSAAGSGVTTTPYAWVELYPAPPVVLYNINCGDRMTVSVSRSSAVVWDRTLGDKDVQPLSYTGPQTTAEVIDEAPGNEALAPFGKSSFSGISVSGKVTGSALETLNQPGIGAIVSKISAKSMYIRQTAG